MFSRIALTITAIISLCCLPGKASEAADESKVVIVPSRYTLVKLGFDLAKLRSVKLMSYHDNTTTSETLLYEWNRRLRAWDPVDLSVYRSGGAVEDNVAAMVVLIGSDKQIPASLINESSWADTVVRIESLDMVTLANSLDRIFNFSAAEWRWLSGKYGLKLKDLNEDLRRWGKYGKPGTQQKKPATQSIIDETTIQQTEKKIAPSSLVIEEVAPLAVEEEKDNAVVIEKEDADIAPEDK